MQPTSRVSVLHYRRVRFGIPLKVQPKIDVNVCPVIEYCTALNIRVEVAAKFEKLTEWFFRDITLSY